MTASIFLLLSREAWHLVNLAQEPVYLASGFYFPIKNLNFWLAVGASLIPLTLGLDAMRQLAFASGPAIGFLSVPVEMWVLVALCVIFLVGARLLLDYMERLAIREGRLTDVGQVLLEHAERLLNLREGAQQALLEVRELQQGKLSIAANEFTALYLLPVLAEFLEDRGMRLQIDQPVITHPRLKKGQPAAQEQTNDWVGHAAAYPSNMSLQRIGIPHSNVTLVKSVRLIIALARSDK